MPPRRRRRPRDAGLDALARPHVALSVAVLESAATTAAPSSRKRLDDRRTDSRAAAGHERALAFQPSHDFLRVACDSSARIIPTCDDRKTRGQGGARHRGRLRHRPGDGACASRRRERASRGRPARRLGAGDRRRDRRRRARSRARRHVAREASAARLDAVVQRFGGIDVVVNNAGVTIVGAAHELDEADWDKELAANLKGIYLVSKAAWPHLVERGGGAILVDGLDRGHLGDPGRRRLLRLEGRARSCSRSAWPSTAPGPASGSTASARDSRRRR